MNILVDELSESIYVDGKQHKIKPDHTNCLLIILAFEDNDLTPEEKQYVMLNNLYVKIPDNALEASKAAVRFLDGDRLVDADDERIMSLERSYSFSKDASLIYSAFKQTHNIDLQADQLHWWKFLSLFNNLGSETNFCQLIGLRKRLSNGKATKEERELARELHDLIEVPEIDNRTLQQKDHAQRFDDLVKFHEERRKNDRV